jgi:hypothetical protein
VGVEKREARNGKREILVSHFSLPISLQEADMTLWLDVEDSSGTKLGDGAILSVVGWEQTHRLSRMGRFACRVASTPLGVDRAKALLQPLRVVRCWSIVNGQRVEVGAGIIERVTVQAEGMLWVEGDDLLRELTYRRVHGLALYEETTYTPTIMLESGGVFTVLTNATDGNGATYDEITLAATGDFLYIGLPLTFNKVAFTLSVANSNSATAQWGFSDNRGGWREPFITDGTILAGAPLGQSGNVTFVRPGAWAVRTLNGLTLYWMRLDPSAALTAVRLNEVTATVRTVAMDDITQIMGFAPTGWGLDLTLGYDGTTNGTQQTFAEETVLAALVKTAERTGEAFRLGNGRNITWLRRDTPDSGVVATFEARADGVATILALELVHDSETVVTRVYPYGAGNGAARVTLSEITLTPPTGYTLDTVNNTIVSTTAEAIYGQIEGVLYLKEIRAGDGSAAPDQSASNELFIAALAWLQHRDAVQTWVRLTLGGVAGTLLQVGDTFRVLGQGLDEPLIVLESTVRVGETGIYTVEVLAGTVARLPQSEAETMAARLARAEAYMTHAQGVAESSVR